jgi:hypothetical protein
MALRVAVATGNWSSTATWNGGVLPGPGDIVASNNFTVTIDQNINVGSLTNAAATFTTLTPLMTSNTTPSGIVSASSILATNYDAWKAFDGNAATSEWLTANNTPTGWLAYEFTTPKKVAKYIMNPATASAPSSVPRDWTFEGWTGSSWVVLDTVTGNSGTANVTRNFVNTTAYIKYRINITLNNGSTLYTGIRELSLYEAYDYGANSIAGGGFTLNNGVSATATNGFYNGAAVQLITFSLGSGQSASVIGNLYGGLASGSASIGGVVAMNGVGTLNIIGTLYSGAQNNAEALKINSAGTINITGNIEDNNSGVARQVIIFFAAATINLTGNIISSTTSGGITIASALVNGNGTAFKMYVTGNLLSSLNSCIGSGGASYISIVGTIQSRKNTVNNGAAVALTSSNAGAINLFSGPFICSEYGNFPYQVTRMHLIPSTSNYIEFRDETTNGALSPGAIAPATRMIAPAAVSDAPSANNVRFGTVYANGSQTGTLKMPTAASVAYGIPVDNTVGSAVLNAEDIWKVPLTSITTTGSIGKRLKNAATVQSTGDQITALK